MDHATDKTAIRHNSKVYRKRVKRGRKENDQVKVREFQNITNKLIREAKQINYSKLGERLIFKLARKNFWNTFKRISNKSKYRNIPPIV